MIIFRKCHVYSVTGFNCHQVVATLIIYCHVQPSNYITHGSVGVRLSLVNFIL